MQHSTRDKDPLISPLSGAESLFLGAALEATDISAATMLEQLEQNKNKQYLRNNASGRIKKSGSFHTAQGSEVGVDDFMSAVENVEDLDSVGSNDNANSHFPLRPFRVYMETIDDTISTTTENIMSSYLKKSTTKKAMPKKEPLIEVKPVEKPVEAPVEAPAEPMKLDAAEAVYGKAKGILAWGKSVPVVGFFVGTSEAVAGKALGVVGTDLSALDTKIEGELTKFDSGVLTPAISAIAKILMGVAGKSEETFKPIIMALMKPLGFLIKSEASEETPEAHTETPEVTA